MWVRKRGWERCSLSPSLLLFSTFTKHSHTSKRARRWSTPTSPLSTLRGRAWRLESGEIEGEEEEEEVEEDVCDEERKKI